MSYTITVLLENGRRQRVPAKLNTPILAILEEVCKKHKLNAEEYDLKCNNRILDVTSTIQFSGVTNNAQLELVRAVKLRTESPVTVFLQLESGERLSGTFLPSCILWDVINELCSEEIKSRENPVIIFTRQEVSGEKLKTTTLKMIGVTGGNVLLRLLHRSEEQLKTQSVSSVYIIPPKPKSEEFFEKRKPKEGSLKDLVSDVKVQSKPYNAVSQSEEICASSASSCTPGQLEERISKFMSEQPQSKLLNSTEQIKTSSPTQTSEKLLTDSLTKTERQFNIDDVEFIGERYALVFRTDAVSSPRFDDTSDDFFELTAEDAKSLLRDIRRTRSELEEAQLETSASRARKQSMQLERTISIYPHCVVRILFPNRFALQGVFKSTESVLDVMQFVKTFLETSALDFYLYTSPPKTVLKLNNTLVEIGAVPGINLYFGGEQVELRPDGPFLHQKFIDREVSPYTALKVADYFRRGTKKKAVEPTPSTSPVSSPSVHHERDLGPASSIRPVLRHETPKPGGGKVPKWFKPL